MDAKWLFCFSDPLKVNFKVFDNGKIRVSLLEGIPLVEIYHCGELDLDDLEWIVYVIFHELSPPLTIPTDIIFDRKGNYSASEKVLAKFEDVMKNANRVAYVVYCSIQEQTVQMLVAVYLPSKQVASFSSVADALAWLKQGTHCLLESPAFVRVADSC